MSKTIIGLILALVGILKTTLKWDWLDTAEAESMLNSAFSFVGILVAWYGRVNAKGPIGALGFRLPVKGDTVARVLPFMLLATMPFALGACATTETAQPDDSAQKAKVGEGDKDTSAAGFGSVATTRRGAKLHDGAAATASGGGGEIIEPIVLWNPETKTWQPIFGADGNPLTKTVRGLRDYHNYIGSTLSVSATGSGTTASTGLTQGQTATKTATSTPTSTVSPETNVSGTPGQ